MIPSAKRPPDWHEGADTIIPWQQARGLRKARGLRIVIVEDDALLACQLQTEAEAAGHRVIGPFPAAAAATAHLDGASAAILDVRAQDSTTFGMAGELRGRDIPFVFLTGYDRTALPPELRHAPVYRKPAETAALLRDLTVQGNLPRGSFEAEALGVLPLLRLRARLLVPDRGAADRLVEAALEQAIALLDDRPAIPRLSDWLLAQLAAVHDRRHGRFMN